MADENMSIAGSVQINGKTELPGKKAEKRRRKAAQKPSQKSTIESAMESAAVPDATEPRLEAREPADAPAASSEPAPAVAPISELDPAVPPTGDTFPPEPAITEESAAVSVQAITDAYGSYTKQSFEQTASFFTQIAGTRSLNRALELQADFARAAFETFVTESRKIRELHRELAKQRLNSLEGFVMGRNATRSR